jgi:hypothetical protein
MDLHLLLLVLHQLKLFMVIKQIIYLSPIDLIHGNRHCEVPLVLLEISNAPVEQILDSQLLQPVHCECLP